MLDVSVSKIAQTDYGYINARVRAMSTELLRQDMYKKLLETDGVKAVFSSLQNTDYGVDLEEAQDRFANFMPMIAVFEKALEQNFQRKLDKLRAMLGGEARNLLSLLLERWDVQNIKTVLRHKHIHADYDAIIKDLSFSGNMPRALFETLARVEDVDAAIRQLDAWGIEYAESLRGVYDEYVGVRRYLLLEVTLDNAYYKKVLSDSQKKRRSNYRAVYGLIRQEIDMLNLLTGLRLVKAGVSIEQSKEYFILGGEKFDEKLFNNLVKSSTLEEAFDYLRKRSYHKILESRWELYTKIKDLSVFERSLGEEIIKNLYRQRRQDALGFGIILGYLRFKFTELTNLRIIGRCKEFKVPEDIIRGELILFR